MLAGDHPSIPGVWVPNPAADLITLDTATAATNPVRGRPTGWTDQSSVFHAGNVTGTITAGESGDFFTFVMPGTVSTLTSLVGASGVATAATAVAHTFVIGDRVTISGATPSGYNGTFVVASVPDNTHFTFVSATSGAATGTITAAPWDFVSAYVDTINTAVASTLDSSIEVYNSAGQLITSGANNSGATAGVLSNGLYPSVLPAGVTVRAPDGWAGFEGQAGQTYYIRVKADSTIDGGRTNAGTYILRLDASSVTTTVDLNPDVVVGMQTIPNVDFGRVFNQDTIATREEDIVYRVTTPNDARFNSLATFQAMADDNTLLNPHIDIYSTGDNAGVVQRLGSDQDAGRQTDSFTTLLTSKATTYYIRVRADDLRVAPTGQALGVYQMVTRLAANNIAIDLETRLGQTGRVVTSSDDPADPWTNIPLRTSSTSMAPRAGVDAQVFKFTAQGTGLGIITVVAQQAARPATMTVLPALPQPAMRLYDKNGNFVDFNKGNGSAQLLTSVVGNQTYYLVVEGFDNAADGGFRVFIEAHHTFDQNQPVDDHINTPANPTLPGLQLATPLRFDDPFQVLDDDGNPLRDRTWLQTATGRGRIHDAGDTDLFQFVAPTNQLSTYPGNDGNEGAGIYVGGNFLTAGVDPRTGNPYDGANIDVFDANAWFNVGPATEPNGAINGPVFAMASWDADGAGGAPPVLAVGGRFTMVAGLTVSNIAFRVFDANVGHYVWSADPLDPANGNPLSINGPVFTMAVGDVLPVEFQNGFAGDELYIGGQFTNAGLAVNNIVGFANIGGAIGATAIGGNGGGVTGGTNPGVFAMTIWNPAAPPPFTLPAGSSLQVPPPEPDLPVQLFFGGRFTTANGAPVAGGERTAVNNVARFGLNGASGAAAAIEVRGLPNDYTITLGNGVPGTAVPRSWGVTATGATGGVFSMTTWDDAGQFTNNDGAVTDTPRRLVLGGSFTRVVQSNNLTVTNLVGYDYSIITDFTPNPAPFGLRRFVNLFAQGVGNSIPNPIRALSTWHLPDTTGGVISDGMDEILAVGGDGAAANTGALNFVVAAGQAPIAFAATNGTIRTILAFKDNEIGYAPGTNADGSLAEFEAIHIGGDFTQIDGNDGFNHVARLRLDLAGPGFNWEGFREGTAGVSPGEVPGTVSGVYSLFAFDDDVATVWDRNERAASRVSIVLSKPADSRLNDATIRVFDSNFNLVYTNTTIDPTGANDVPGGNDPSLVPLIPNPGDPGWKQTGAPFPGFRVWAGEVYYIEVGGTGTGRYSFTVTTDALPPRPDPVNQDPLGAFPDDISQFTQPVGKGQFETAPEIQLGADGKGHPFLDPLADPATPPSAYSVRNYRATPAGLVRTEYSDGPVIARVTDTNLFQFRAPNDGTVEIRLSTIGITRAYQEVWTDTVAGTQESHQALAKTINSPFHGAIRAYDNDRVQVGYSNSNSAVAGFADQFFVLQPNPNSNPPEAGTRVFSHNDPRLVINVRRGNVYFIEVESAFKGTFASNPDLVDWRFATGAYDLIISATPSVTGGQSVDDFWPSFDVGGQPPTNTLNETAIPVDRLTGAGTISGEIKNIASGPFTNPNDIDTFSVISEGRGFFTVRVTPTNPVLAPRVRVFDDTGTLVTTASGGVGGVANLQFPVTQGERYFIAVDGAGTQGTYTVNVVSPVQADDQPFSTATPNDLTAPVGGWATATTLQLNRFLGVYGGQTNGTGPVGAKAGSIENPDDRDIYKFTSESYEIATVNVNRVDTTLDPLVLVYELNQDGAGKEVFLLIAFNDDANANTTNSQATFSITPGRDYYVVVLGSSLDNDFGRYNLTVTVAPSDDHPNNPLLAAPANTPDPAQPTDFPNGSIINLTFDSINFTSTGTIGGVIERNTDSDLFRFTAPASGTGRITIAQAVGSTLALDIVVLDANNTPIPGITFTPGTGTLTSSNFNIVQGQQYYLLVRPNATVPPGGTDTGAYTITVNTDPVDDYLPTPGTANPANGDFTGAPAITINSVNGIGTITGVLVPVGDSDLFKFTTLATGPVTVRISTPLSTLNPQVRIFDSSQSLVFTAAGNGDSATVTFNATGAAQTYYVLVLADTSAAGVTAVGTYTTTVTVALPGGGGGGPGPDDYPNAGEWADAANIGLDTRTGNGAISGVISPAADTDLFKFTVPGSGFVDIQLNTPTGGLVDGQIRIFNSAHTQVFFDSAGIPGATAAIKFAATAGETYFVLVEPVGTATGSYTLRLSTQPTTHYLYFPEGFTGSTINEFISMLNPNSYDVDFQVYARYETGQNDDVPVYTGSINANSRGGVTISTTSNQAGALVRIGVPYSLEVRSTGPLGATFSHYDFNTAVGEAFTSRTSNIWTFAEINKDTNNFRDFILYYNPGSVTAHLNVSLYYQDGSVVTFPATIDSLRRNGINFDNDTRVTRGGKFGVKIESDQPIVASLTSYNLPRGGGDGVLGDADGGSTQGVITNISSGGGVTSSISFVNTNSQPATVTITADYGRTDIPKLVRVYTVGPNSQLSKNLAAVGLIAGQTAGITYSSNIPVTAQALEYKFGDGDSTTTATAAARSYFMGDLFVNTATAGITYIEQLGLYNPGAVAIDVSATFLFADGSAPQTTTFHVGAGTFSFVSLDQQPIVLGHGGLVFYSLKLDSATPFIASVTHYDLFLNGGWSALGAPIGLSNSLATLT